VEGPYGALISTTVRVLTWNVWGRYGPWEARQAGLLHVLTTLAPDVVTLQESWRDRDGDDQAALLAQTLGYHHVFAGGTFLENDWATGSAVLARWPIEHHELRQFPCADPDRWGGTALYASVAGPRGTLPVWSVALDWPTYASAVRQASVHELAAFVREISRGSVPPIVAGDFNAPPDADEIRLLTGRKEPAVSKFALFDAWEMAGDGPGHTWARTNPWAATALMPDRRIDYIFVGSPRSGGAGHVVRCSLEGADAIDGVVPSDHYAVCADLRY
jgi:endonuclease/exonuclease/phosphatase family metal-dependent hydrolase